MGLVRQKTRPVQRESLEQQYVVSHARTHWPDVPIMCSTGGKKMSGRTKWARIKQGHINKLEGYEPGTSNLFFLAARKGYHGLVIEMKKTGETPSSVTKKQWEFIRRATKQGYYAVPCYGERQAIERLDWYFYENDHPKAA
jgi:hypothetical protein